MPGYIFLVGEKDHPFSIRRNVGKPIVVLVGEDLLLLTAICLHPPDLHVACSLRVEINVLTVGRIFWAIVESFCRSEACLVTSGDRNCVDIKVAIALPDKCECLPVRRPAMPVRWCVLG